MSDPATKIDWQPVIGLEVHVQLDTQSKAFSGSAVAFGATANALTDPTVLGLPGALPVFNQQALSHAVALGLATSCTIRQRSRFARKHYFYPDQPKGYQISQYDEPLCEHGAVEFLQDGAIHRVRLTRIHLEEDAGKSVHSASGHSHIDLNRAGVPLCEVVSEPDIRSASEAAEYMRALRQLVRYLGISAGDMEKGQLRCDANVSVRPRGQATLGTRTELKNINSFRFVQHAIEHEIARQIRVLERGGTIVQETRLWDADIGTSRTMRTKEDADDYRYLPDPDLPVLVVEDQLMNAIAATMPELPMARARRYLDQYGLAEADVRVLIAEPAIADFLDQTVGAHKAGAAGARAIGNWMQSELLGALKRDDRDLADCPMTPAHLAELVELIDSGVISGKIAKDVFADVYQSGERPSAIVEKRGLRQISDEGALAAIAQTVLDENQGQVAAYRGGKHKLMGFFVGQVMKKTRGQANPALVNQLLQRLLAE